MAGVVLYFIDSRARDPFVKGRGKWHKTLASCSKRGLGWSGNVLLLPQMWPPVGRRCQGVRHLRGFASSARRGIGNAPEIEPGSEG